MHQVTIDKEDRNSLSLLSVSYYNHEDKEDSIARLLSTSFSLPSFTVFWFFFLSGF